MIRKCFFPPPEKLEEKAYEEYALGFAAAIIGVALAKGDKFLSQPLGFFSFVPSCGDGFVREERGYKVPQERLAVRGLSA